MAMNSTTDAADGYELSLATKNRIAWLPWEPPAYAWYDGFSQAWGEPMEGPLGQREAKIRQRIVSFLKKNPAYLQSEKVLEGNPRSYGIATDGAVSCFESAYPSRRSWENAAKTLARAIEPEQPPARQREMALRVLEHLVGWEVASEFISNLFGTLPDYDSILKKGLNWSWSDDTLQSCVQILVEGILPGDGAKVIDWFVREAESSGRRDILAPFAPRLVSKLSQLGEINQLDRIAGGDFKTAVLDTE
jgi:hypothetical protein